MNKIDFLPVVCIYCNKVFCGDHRLPFDHDCREYSLHDREAIQCPQCQKFLRTPSVDTQKTNAEQIVEEHLKSRCVLHCILTETKDPKFRCSVSGCNHKESVVGKVHCDKCDHDFCVKHRHPLSHQCISLNADEERKVQRREAAQEKLAKTFKPPPSSPVTQRKANRDTAQKKNTMVEMMKIKAKAKGLTSVPLNSRIYLYVHFPKETHTEPQPMFFDKYITVGKTLDMLADHCGIKNKNHQVPLDDSERLGIYRYPEHTVLEMGAKLDSALSSLDTIALARKDEITEGN